jgi:hypothetical protein
MVPAPMVILTRQNWRRVDGAMVLTKGNWQAVVTTQPGEHAFGKHDWVITRKGKVQTRGVTTHNRKAMGEAWATMAALMALVEGSNYKARTKAQKVRARVQEMLDASTK